MYLNIFSGRSHNDVTQYFVFPWIFSLDIICTQENIEIQNKNSYRNLQKTMGALGSQKRIEKFKEKYELSDPFNQNIPSYFFGSHYSSPAIVFQFLIRIQPFGQGALLLQNGKFDIADRLFFSISETYKNATEEMSDVRELIPEFFYLPEFFLNMQKHDFGIQQTGERVHNVILPQWSLQNPFLFVFIHRKGLESEFVCENINQWINLIFGIKQKGKEAEIFLNKFFYLTYEDSINIDQIKNEDEKISIESQVMHFGQTPSQILNQQFPVKNCFFEEEIFIFCQKFKFESILIIQIISEKNRIFTFSKKGIFQLFKIQKNGFSLKNVWNKQLNFFSFSSFDFSCKFKNLPFLTYSFQEKIYFLIGGYIDGQVQFYSFSKKNDSKQIIQNNFINIPNNNSTITAFQINEDDQIIFMGNKQGELAIFQFNPLQEVQIQEITRFYQHFEEITCLQVSKYLKILASSSLDGTINIYNYFNYKFLRNISHPKMLSINSFLLVASPVCSILFFSSQDCVFYSYSINGQLLSKYQEDTPNIYDMNIIKNDNFMEFLVFFYFILFYFQFLFIYFRFIQIMRINALKYQNYLFQKKQK
ncbi:hypothetical protein IMG5_076820 [Ichthyophthirius multifiliis]|uniref:BEACH domain-containing protein n=1 Tax=Ichthyophthirius multifiliis TaxID=5932 RepID=G0QQC8_ICHMU|nr:hypothetical protein IMG5_076820 [Ichthyophthirius multifiliis]EGR32579.1 hypothetical protein IMG5_076820 [Ichthyophthirius multifiliis]|eukprot:XP_004036565.1 hypothetical protein IMG5_076820 [Ichthyophthirius multifiliis]